MNNAKMWLVVKPTVGIPLFLSAVAIGSFAVHVAVLSNTNWVSNFLQGKGINAASLVVPNASVAKFDGKDTVILPDGRVAKIVIEENTKTAMLPAQ
jgi:light-harvesting protein B-800-850 alpha chain